MGFGNLRLNEIKLTGNRLKILDNDCFLPNLINAKIWIDNNHLTVLPQCIENITNIADLKIDMNPLRSPPMELLNEGILTVVNYSKARSRRLKKLKRLLIKENFIVNMDCIICKVNGVLSGGTNFLTRNDLNQFDQSIDALVNGNFYLNSNTIEHAVEEIKLLRQKRRHANFSKILNAVLNVLWIISSSEKSKTHQAIIRSDITQPWGRNKENVQCFAFPMKYLFQDLEPNHFFEDGCSSIWNMAKEELSHNENDFNQNSETILKAFTFQSPYGKVSSVKKVSYDTCICVDEKNNLIRHRNCRQESIVISKIIYTAEEAERRSEEENMMDKYLNIVETRIDDFCKGRKGQKIVNAETKLRRNMITNELKQLNVNLKQTKNELNIAREAAVVARRRKEDFEAKKPFPYHSIENITQAEDLVNKANENVNQIREKYECQQQHIYDRESGNKKRTRLSVENEVIRLLKKKYCDRVFQMVSLH